MDVEPMILELGDSVGWLEYVPSGYVKIAIENGHL